MYFWIFQGSDDEEADDNEQGEPQNEYATISPPPEYASQTPRSTTAAAVNDSWAESEPSEAEDMRKKVSCWGILL